METDLRQIGTTLYSVGVSAPDLGISKSPPFVGSTSSLEPRAAERRLGRGAYFSKVFKASVFLLIRIILPFHQNQNEAH